MKSLRLILLAMLAVFLLSACGSASPTDPAALTLAPATTATADLTLTPLPEGLPTSAIPARELRLYSHASGVFYLSIPEGWEIVDESDVLTLRLRFIPPPGYGSRMSLTITNVGPLVPDAQRALADSRIADIFESDPRYSAISRTDDGVGRFIATADYNDGAGGTGQETMVLQQVGPFFAVERAFLADTDQSLLGDILRQSAESLYIDPLAIWGSRAVGINPAELLITNDRVWMAGDTTIYAGDVFNGSSYAISGIQVHAAFCSAAGAVRREVIEDAIVTDAGPGERVPFYIMAEDLPRNLTVCISQVTAEPAIDDPLAAHSLTTTLSLGQDERGDTAVLGQIINQELVPVVGVVLSVVLYDSEGLVAGYGQFALDPAEVLMPGAVSDFIITFDDLAAAPASYTAYTAARRYDPADPSLVP